MCRSKGGVFFCLIVKFGMYGQKQFPLFRPQLCSFFFPVFFSTSSLSDSDLFSCSTDISCSTPSGDASFLFQSRSNRPPPGSSCTYSTAAKLSSYILIVLYFGLASKNTGMSSSTNSKVADCRLPRCKD